MINISRKQDGSAHIAIVIILVAALLGALGFIFWQNFIYEEPVSTKTETIKIQPRESEPDATEVKGNKKFSNDDISFEYPGKDWEEKDDPFDSIARIQTANYEPNVGMGLKSGADLTINETTEDVAPPQLAGISNVEEVQLSIGMGYKYEIRYEGYRLQAKVLSKGPRYIITMQTSGEPTSSEKDAFDLVLKTLSVK